MKDRILIPLSFSVVSIFLFAGCFGVDHNFSSIRNEILSAAGDNFHKDVEFSIGRAGIGIAKIFVKIHDENEDAEKILRHVDEVQVGVYKNHYHSMPNDKFDLLESITYKMDHHGWQYIVKNYNRGEVNIVYVMKNSGYKLKKMFVVSLNRNELTMVEITGDLDKVITSIIREKGLGISYASVD